MSTAHITQTTAEILDRLCHTAAQAVGGLAAEVAVWDDTEKQLIIHAFSGPPPPARGWAIGDGALGRAWREPKPRLDSSLADLEPDALSFATKAGADAVFILPITNSTRVIGLLLVFRSGNPGRVWDDIDLLRLFAQQAAIALENGELAARQQALAHGLALASRELEAEVTRRQAAEAALRQVQEQFAVLFRNSPVGIALARLDDGILLDANDLRAPGGLQSRRAHRAFQHRVGCALGRTARKSGGPGSTARFGA
jgi:GAF domain-containing protein